MVYEMEDLHGKFRLEISELLLILGKNMGLRKIFLNKYLHSVIVHNSLQFIN